MKRFIFIGIVLLAAILRVYRLGDVPVGLHRDEAFLGYNAYSILKTGQDMTGNALPLHFESFLYSPAGYSYLAIPAIATFGLTPFAVRLPSAVFGTLTVVAIYILAAALFKKRNLGLLSSFVLAISPWHINLSRTATENTIVVFLLAIATSLFITYLHRKHFGFFFVSIVLFSSTYLFYQAPRAFVPFLVPVLLIYGWKNISRNDRLRVGFVTALFIFLPVLLIVSSSTLSLRIRTVSIFASAETQLKIDEALRENTIANVPALIARLFHNKIAGYAELVASNYFQHFSYDFLLTDKGLPARYRVPGAGLTYPWELLFAIVGAVSLLRTSPHLAYLLLGWIALAPIGSALTSDDVPNLQRTLIFFPALSLVTAYGINRLQKIHWKILLVCIAVYGLVTYLHSYYVMQIYHRPWYRHEGYKALVEEVNRLLPNYTKAVITNHESSPTIFFLFYNRTDPTLVQQIWQKDKTADLNTLSFGNYVFSKEACPTLTAEPKVLYVNFSDCKVKDPRIKLVSAVRRSDGTEVFRLLQIQ
jgi:4-amino-4-deoxy-L-arabinose transferase-like glycosyltransferase